MIVPVDVKLFFNFRSPYCYIASKTLFEIFDNYNTNLVWKPLGGWTGRSSPDRAKVKVPLTRQDVKRITGKMGIPMNPPPITTDPSNAGAGSILAEQKGVLREYLVEMMREEWAEGKNIGDTEVILSVGERVGLVREELAVAIESPENHALMENNWQEAQELGVIGVPTFVIGEEIFWGSDRIEFVLDYLREQRLAKL
jgi:2-hydroxychromene-2-carboxylate isomerase